MLKIDRMNKKMLENIARQRAERLSALASCPNALRSFTVTDARRGQWQVGVHWWDTGASDYVTCVHAKLRRYYTVSPYKFEKEVGCYYYWSNWGSGNVLSNKLTEQFDMIDKYRQVLVTLDEANDELTVFKRTGYLGIYKVSQLNFDDEGWGFQFDEIMGHYKK
jgi:hypothetical protein